MASLGSHSCVRFRGAFPDRSPRGAREDAAPALPMLVPGFTVKRGFGSGGEVFLSERALCSKCHAVRGTSGMMGLDLSNLVSRDYATTLRDIEDPSAVLHPDALTHRVVLKDGRELIAVPRTATGRIRWSSPGSRRRRSFRCR